MPAKKKAKKKNLKRKPTTSRSSSKNARKVSTKSRSAKKTAANQKAKLNKKTAKNKPSKKQRGRGREIVDSASLNLKQARNLSEVESGDLQALSNRAEADSESVDELIEEGNAFEAGVVAGVEHADDADESEVRTREVPEDDVPEEYLNED